MSSLSTIPNNQKKYGLIQKSNKQTRSIPLKTSIFQDNSDDEDMNCDKQFKQVYTKSSIENINKMNDIDGSIYDYDGAYDNFKAKEISSHPLSRDTQKNPPVSVYYEIIHRTYLLALLYYIIESTIYSKFNLICKIKRKRIRSCI